MTTTTPVATEDPGYFGPLTLADLRESPMNPRKTFTGIDELAASVGAQGILVPLTVRVVDGAYEIVNGARRYRAAKKAKLAQVPAVVAAMSDEQALDAMITENLQRADVHPLEEADAFDKLVKGDAKRGIPPRTVAAVAARVGKTEAFVYQRIRLTSLAGSARKAFQDGKFNPSVALLLARIPSSKLQEEAVKHLDDLSNGDGISTDRAREIITSEYMLRLDQAPFAITDGALDPKAGACVTCPKRTGNQRELFNDIKSPDLCTDPICYRRKLDLRWGQVADEGARSGRKVLSPTASKKVYRNDWDSAPAHDSGYVDLATKNYNLPKAPIWKKVLGKDAEPHIVMARDTKGGIHELIPVERARSILAKTPAGMAAKASRVVPNGQDGDWKKQEERRRAEANRVRTVVRAATAQLVAIVEAQRPDEIADDDGFWSILIDGVMDGSWSDTIRDVVARRGWSVPKKQPSDVLQNKAKDMAGAELRGLAVELIISRRAGMGGARGAYGDTFRTACLAYKVDLKKLEDEVKAADKATAAVKAEKGKTPKKVGKVATADAPAPAEATE